MFSFGKVAYLNVEIDANELLNRKRKRMNKEKLLKLSDT